MGLMRRLFGGGSSDSIHGDSALTKALKLTSEGNHYGGQGSFDRAISCYQKALSAKADHIPAFMGLSVAYRMTGQFDRAVDTLNAAQSISNASQLIDLSFEIAFFKVSALLEKYRRSSSQNDKSDLVEAVVQARDIGQRSRTMPEMQRNVERALGDDSSTEHQEWRTFLDNLYSGLTDE